MSVDSSPSESLGRYRDAGIMLQLWRLVRLLAIQQP